MIISFVASCPSTHLRGVRLDCMLDKGRKCSQDELDIQTTLISLMLNPRLRLLDELKCTRAFHYTLALFDRRCYSGTRATQLVNVRNVFSHNLAVVRQSLQQLHLFSRPEILPWPQV